MEGQRKDIECKIRQSHLVPPLTGTITGNVRNEEEAPNVGTFSTPVLHEDLALGAVRRGLRH
ncbi:hypothetical protein AB6A23_14355 [Paenibacillus tarimensis]